MCLIIDINVAAVVLLDSGATRFDPIREALTNPHVATPAHLHYGGRLRREYQGNRRVRRFVLALERAGRALQFPDAPIDAEEERLIRKGACSSDDQHIVALARLHGARLLITDDKDLRKDFKTKALIDSPRGSVYKDGSHAHLLRKCC